jgi:hypothetical protein
MTDSSPNLSEELETFKKLFATQLTESWTLTKTPEENRFLVYHLGGVTYVSMI